MRVANAPFTVLALPVRGAALTARGALAPASRLARIAGDAAIRRGARRGMEGVPFGTRWGNLGERLHGVSDTLARGAELGRRVAAAGQLGTRKSADAHNTLGVRRAATSRQIADAFATRSRRLREAPGGRFSRPGLSDPVRAARHEALVQAIERVLGSRAALAVNRFVADARKAAEAEE